MKTKTEIEEKEDRLSLLEDGVLGAILSFLPIKVGVSSSVLSWRWINVYKYIFTLNLDHKLLGDSRHKRMETIKKVLDAVENARVIRLHWSIERDDADEWNQLSALLEPLVDQVKELYVNMMPIIDLRFFDIIIWRNLVKLHLHGGFNMCLSTSLPFTLPFLNEVHLSNVEFLSNEALSCFFKGCPNLVEFYAVNIEWRDVTQISITSPRLERLCLCFNGYWSFSHVATEKAIKLDCPSLTELSYFDICTSEFSVLSDSIQVVKMGFKILGDTHLETILQAVNSAPRIHLLALMGIVEVNGFESCNFPQFNNQTTLNLYVLPLDVSCFCGIVSSLMDKSLKSLYIGQLKGSATEIEITEEDGETASKFRELLTRFHQLKFEIQLCKEIGDNLEDCCELILNNQELASFFPDVPENELETLLEERMPILVEEHEEEMKSVAAQMAELKKILALKFKDFIC